MNRIVAVNFRSFKKRALACKRKFRRFLSLLQKNPVRGLDRMTAELDQSIWKEIDCLSCANCCKTMTPTYTPKDIKRISRFLEMTPSQFKSKWLIKERGTGDWLNKSNPCQFLHPQDNTCSVYEVRPDDCSGFPHLSKKRMIDYMHVHKQNLESCPATFKMVERMMEQINNKTVGFGKIRSAKE